MVFQIHEHCVSQNPFIYRTYQDHPYAKVDTVLVHMLKHVEACSPAQIWSLVYNQYQILLGVHANCENQYCSQVDTEAEILSIWILISHWPSIYKDNGVLLIK